LHGVAEDGLLFPLVLQQFADMLVLRRPQEYHVFSQFGRGDSYRLPILHGLPLVFGQFDHGSLLAGILRIARFGRQVLGAATRASTLAAWSVVSACQDAISRFLRQLSA